jgi:retinol dehydrogenase-13
MSTTDGFSRTALEAAKMNGSQDGKVFVITGAYSGIGVETTKALLEVGGKVIIGGRNEANLKKFSDEMADKYGKDKVDSFLLDLGDLASVKEFSNYINGKYATIDVLILNAGVMNTPLGATKNGFETQIGTNVVGHFLLAKILAPKTKRQVWVSSFGHTRDDGQRFSVEECRNFDVNAVDKYDGFHQYQQSKIGNVMLPKEFAKRYESMEAVSLHPGKILCHTFIVYSDLCLRRALHLLNINRRYSNESQ